MKNEVLRQAARTLIEQAFERSDTEVVIAENGDDHERMIMVSLSFVFEPDDHDTKTPGIPTAIDLEKMMH